MFNNYIFDKEQKEILMNHLSCGRILILLDPPFGGRVEPLANTLKLLSQAFLKVNNKSNGAMGKWKYIYIKKLIKYFLKILF